MHPPLTRAKDSLVQVVAQEFPKVWSDPQFTDTPVDPQALGHSTGSEEAIGGQGLWSSDDFDDHFLIG